MILKSEIIELAKILDEDIEKAERSKKRTKVEHYEEQITKAFSHDPFRPHTMGEDSPYYNPYRQMADGSFLPHPAAHWENQPIVDYDLGNGRYVTPQRPAPDAYLTTRILYERYLDKPNGLTMLRRSLEQCDLIKAGAVPIGTIHTYRDGQKYKKIAEGKWTPVAGLESKKMQENWLESKDPKKQQEGIADLEAHAGQTSAINEAIKKKESEQKTIETAKNEAVAEAMKNVQAAMKHLFDGEMPPKLAKLFEKHAEAAKENAKPKPSPEENLKTMATDLQKKHHVTVHFTAGGKQYEHKFPNVGADGTSAATQKVQDLFSKRFRGAQIHRIKAEAVRPEKTKDKSGEL